MRAAGGERQPWEFGRFLQTVLFFNPPQDVLKKLFGGGAQQASSSSGASAGMDSPIQTLIAPVGTAAAAAGEQPAVLVTGATGGVGKRVVARLLQRGKRVRALVRDVDKARGLLGALPAAPGASLELVAADLTQPATILPGALAGVRQVVSCSAVKVQPKEGDTADRQKYYQGIKFYDPGERFFASQAAWQQAPNHLPGGCSNQRAVCCAPCLLPRRDCGGQPRGGGAGGHAQPAARAGRRPGRQRPAGVQRRRHGRGAGMGVAG